MSRTRRERTKAEWVVFGLASAVILLLAGAIGWLWTQPYDPPNVTAERVGEARVLGTDSYVTTEVTNDGDETAEAVQVQAEMTVDGEVTAEAEQIVDFLSGGETEEVVFIFSDVPAGAEIEVSVASFKVP
jgi:uncharacterized protein (TIGR02588 family)